MPPFPIIQRENLHQSSQPSTNSIHDQERQARLRSIVNRRRSRSRAPVQEQQEQPTGWVGYHFGKLFYCV
uniref:Uncharacterized protein n=1 Tax=Caenorhabditis japonica TaxID=281687 RepID=A0A8R1EVY7_CAEJA